ncbi:hypothetical protein SCG7086_AO_00030 [Chlamydiales bacterium SCGC AG-110-P3]|nr:hypothetical protein SCG7086_AO_00030 [Chlamydiales bacterium SCGC AG-110-P3]
MQLSAPSIVKSFQAIGGWSSGYAYSIHSQNEVEVAQGGNHYFAGMARANQASLVMNVINKVASTSPMAKGLPPITLKIGFLLSFPFFLFAAAVKQGHYPKVAATYNASQIPGKLPTTLSNRTVKVFTFISDHSNKVFKTAMVASSIALIALGNPFYGAASLTAMAIQKIDEMGYLPRKISLLMEQYLPLLANIGIILTFPLLITKAIVITQLAFEVPAIKDPIHRFIEGLVPVQRGETHLHEFDASIKERYDLSYEEIQTILKDSTSDATTGYSLVPAHCSKWPDQGLKLPTDLDFSKLMPLFDTVDWASKESLLSKKFKNDERFLEKLKGHPALKEEKLGSKDLDLIRKDFDRYVAIVSADRNTPVNIFFANELRGQLDQLVKYLNGESRATGTQQDLDDAIQNCSKLLPYLEGLKDTIEKEDFLLKLSVEGGDYCSRGIKRTSDELLSQVMMHSIDETLAPHDLFKVKVKQALLSKRNSLMQFGLSEIIKKLPVAIPDNVKHDVHTMDLYRTQLGIGFIPLTPSERKAVGFSDIVGWRCYNSVRKGLMKLYKKEMDSTVQALGEVHISQFVRDAIGRNTTLTPEQKEKLLDDFTTEGWSNHVVHKLMFVTLGILKKEPNT